MGEVADFLLRGITRFFCYPARMLGIRACYPDGLFLG